MQKHELTSTKKDRNKDKNKCHYHEHDGLNMFFSNISKLAHQKWTLLYKFVFDQYSIAGHFTGCIDTEDAVV